MKHGLAILKKKTYNDGIELPEEIFEFLAVNISNNIRELEAVLISLYAQSTLNRKEITLDLARMMVEKLINTSRREITIEYIQKIVCEYYKIRLTYIQGKTRKREIVQARQVSMYFSKSLTKASLASIGSHIGGKDHATGPGMRVKLLITLSILTTAFPKTRLMKLRRN